MMMAMAAALVAAGSAQLLRSLGERSEQELASAGVRYQVVEKSPSNVDPIPTASIEPKAPKVAEQAKATAAPEKPQQGLVAALDKVNNALVFATKPEVAPSKQPQAIVPPVVASVQTPVPTPKAQDNLPVMAKVEPKADVKPEPKVDAMTAPQQVASAPVTTAPTATAAPTPSAPAVVVTEASEAPNKKVQEALSAIPLPEEIITSSIPPSSTLLTQPSISTTRLGQGQGSASVDMRLPDSLGTKALRTAAEKGDAAAMYDVGVRYSEGRGVTRDLAAAAKWFEKAAVSGLAPAQYRLGMQYEKGQGVAKDPALAELWYKKAADLGNAKAMHNLAVLYAEGALGKPDYDKAIVWFRKGADFGVVDSIYNLGVLSARGLGMTRDLGQSYTWFALAAQRGDADAGAKRDEIGRSLDSATLASAKARVVAYKPRPLDAAANDVVSAVSTNAPQAQPTTQKKTGG
jgi:localization factor PodJL